MKRITLLTSVFMLVVALCAFGRGTEEPEVKEAEVEAVAVAAPAGPVTLNIGFQDDVKQLNPLKASDVWSWRVLDFIWSEEFYRWSPEEFNWIPWLAVGEPEIDMNNLTAVVKFKKGIKFTDGKPLTADDVVYTVNDIMIGLKIPRYWSNYEFIEKVEKIDDYTVKYYLKEMRASFKFGTLMGFILPKHIWAPIIKECIGGNDISTEEGLAVAQKAVLEYDLKVEQAIGYGPFILKEWKKGEYVLMEKNDDYHAIGVSVKGAEQTYEIGPYIDRVLYKIYKSLDTAILAIKKAEPEIDFIWWTIPPGFVPTLAADPNIYLTTNPQNGMYYLAFNFRKEPYSDKAFRKAMAYLVDKNFIQTRVLQNYGERLDTVVPAGNAYWYNPDVESYGNAENMSKPDRLKNAIGILEAAGYTWEDAENHKGLIMPNGEKVAPFEILTPPADYDPLRAMSGLLIQEWWREVGVPVTAKPTSFGEIVDSTFTNRTFDVFILGWSLTIFPDYIRDFYHSSQDVPDGNNCMGYRNPEFDALADDFVRELDMEKSREKAFTVQEMISDELPYIPIFCKAAIEAHSKRFEGWINQLDGTADNNPWSFLLLRPVR